MKIIFFLPDVRQVQTEMPLRDHIAVIERPIAAAVCLVAGELDSWCTAVQQPLQGTGPGADPDLIADLPGRPSAQPWLTR